LNQAFSFIDVGVSRARASVALKLLLAHDLNMDVEYVATELPDAVPYANVTPLGDRAEVIRRCLSGMISSGKTTLEVTDWHYVVDNKGKVSSVAYAYHLYGNEVWEGYFLGQPFMVSGEKIKFHDPALDEMLAPDVLKIETGMDLEKNRGSHPYRPGLTWEGYRIEKSPLEAGLAEFGITLQKTDIPERINGRQNVLFLGNVLNHYPQDKQARQLDRFSANMQEGDIVIVQVDELEESSIEVLKVKGQGAWKTRERIMWINTSKLEIQMSACGSAVGRQIFLKPELEQITRLLMGCLDKKIKSAEWSQKEYKILVHQYINLVFRTFFRALPVKETLRVAIREALRRLPSEGCMKGIPVFKDDGQDAYGGVLGLDPGPIISEEDLIEFINSCYEFRQSPSAIDNT
jgi:hypothetical protein